MPMLLVYSRPFVMAHFVLMGQIEIKEVKVLKKSLKYSSTGYLP
jgi:hypothetical protein